MDRRQMLTTTALGMGGFVIGTGFAAPACGVSKEKATKYVGLVIDLTEESVPLLDLLGAHDIAQLVSTKAIPALEKLKDALEHADIPTSQSTLATVRNVLKGIETALLNLPDTPRRTTIIGTLASVRMLLLTVEAFVKSEVAPTSTKAASPVSGPAAPDANAEMIRKAFEAVRS